jgi:hypothetical protein
VRNRISRQHNDLVYNRKQSDHRTGGVMATAAVAPTTAQDAAQTPAQTPLDREHAQNQKAHTAAGSKLEALVGKERSLEAQINSLQASYDEECRKALDGAGDPAGVRAKLQLAVDQRNGVRLELAQVRPVEQKASRAVTHSGLAVNLEKATARHDRLLSEAKSVREVAKEKLFESQQAELRANGADRVAYLALRQRDQCAEALKSFTQGGAR